MIKQSFQWTQQEEIRLIWLYEQFGKRSFNDDQNKYTNNRIYSKMGVLMRQGLLTLISLSNGKYQLDPSIESITSSKIVSKIMSLGTTDELVMKSKLIGLKYNQDIIDYQIAQLVQFINARILGKPHTENLDKIKTKGVKNILKQKLRKLYL